MLHIVLIEPEIPGNTGNIARLCAATNTVLHLVHPLGFEISDKYLKRAGLDYWNLVTVREHQSFAEVKAELVGHNFYFLTTKSQKNYCDISYTPTDVLVFGKETAGIPEAILTEHKENCIRIPMVEGARSLNLANSAAICLYEALRQNDFLNLSSTGRGIILDEW